eukprot:scaffold13170_cov60-Phaeocystis_antarctica.AAC.2
MSSRAGLARLRPRRTYGAVALTAHTYSHTRAGRARTHHWVSLAHRHPLALPGSSKVSTVV